MQAGWWFGGFPAQQRGKKRRRHWSPVPASYKLRARRGCSAGGDKASVKLDLRRKFWIQPNQLFIAPKCPWSDRVGLSPGEGPEARLEGARPEAVSRQEKLPHFLRIREQSRGS